MSIWDINGADAFIASMQGEGGSWAVYAISYQSDAPEVMRIAWIKKASARRALILAAWSCVRWQRENTPGSIMDVYMRDSKIAEEISSVVCCIREASSVEDGDIIAKLADDSWHTAGTAFGVCTDNEPPCMFRYVQLMRFLENKVRSARK